MQRLLAMVPWIAAHDGPTLDEVCERFGLTPRELAADLEVMWLVGLPPYTPDALIDVVQEGNRVWIHFAEVFESAQRLTPEQAMALLTAGASVLALPGADQHGALARGVAKLAAVLGVEVAEVLEVDLGSVGPDVLEVLQVAIAEHRRVRLDYYSYGRDAQTQRDVDPYVVHAEHGALYLFAWCHLAKAERRFRVDRIAAAVLREERFSPPAPSTASGVFEPDADDPRVVLDLDPVAAWVAEVYPVEHVEPLADGHLRVRLAVAAQAWLERLLVGLGAHAVVIEAPPSLRDAGDRARARILDRYR